jgi:L-iditol 2-dehydrogenase
MRIAELLEPHRFRLAEGAIAEPGPGEVQVRVDSVGVCGSDLHNFLEGSVGDIPSQYPMVLGHEPTGVVVKTGAGVSGWQAGDRAALEPAVYCYHCEFCRSGHHNVCANLRFLSQPGDPGYFREFVNLPAGNLLPFPAGLSFEEATVFEPLAIILHSMKLAQITAGETVAVFGAGPIGLLTSAAAKLSGAGRVWSIDPVAHRREIALQMGADAVVDPSAVDPSAFIRNETGKRGVDIAFDCATKGGSMNHSLRVTRNAGRVVFTGIPSETSVDFEFHVARRKELAIFLTRRSNHESGIALRMMTENFRRFAPMLTHTRPMDGIQGAFEILERYADGVGKIVIKVSG